ncbi:MAG: hypothetical protein ACP5O7_11890, partial [Phycisphaerae bacterium]
MVKSPEALPGVSPEPPAQALQAETACAAAVTKTPGRKKRFRHLVGRKYIRMLEKYIGDLRRHHPHPNRNLHFDDIVT